MCARTEGDFVELLNSVGASRLEPSACASSFSSATSYSL